MTPIRVLLADDHAIVREGLRLLLETTDGINVVGEAHSGETAVDLARDVPADVIVMDLEMPGIGGVEATRRLLADDPDQTVLVLTMYSDDASLFAAMRAGARGYVLKGADRDDVIRAIQAVARREAIFSPEVAQRLLHFFAATKLPTSHDHAFPQLTVREREVLTMIASGASNGEISRHLSITTKTVRNHVSTILTKLQVRDRAEAVARARDAGLGG